MGMTIGTYNALRKRTNNTKQKVEKIRSVLADNIVHLKRRKEFVPQVLYEKFFNCNVAVELLEKINKSGLVLSDYCRENKLNRSKVDQLIHIQLLTDEKIISFIYPFLY